MKESGGWSGLKLEVAILVADNPWDDEGEGRGGGFRRWAFCGGRGKGDIEFSEGGGGGA